MSDDRFADLETMIAFHEDTIQKLNEVVYRLQVDLDKLEDKVESITQLLQAPDQLFNIDREPKNE